MKVSRRDFFVTTAVGAAGVAAYGAESSPPVTPPEALARYDWIVRKWGSGFTDEQKVDLMRLVSDNEKGLAAMRKYALDNGVEPSK